MEDSFNIIGNGKMGRFSMNFLLVIWWDNDSDYRVRFGKKLVIKILNDLEDVWIYIYCG